MIAGRSPRAAVRAACAAVLVVLAGSVCAACSGPSVPSSVSGSRGTRTTSPEPSITQQLQTPVADPPAAAQPGVPVLITIPRVDIRSTLQPLGLMKDGSLQQPTEFPRAGWYAGGVRPGALGPALIYGHVDSTAGPAVFWNLQYMRVGDAVFVRDAKGTTRRFVVVRIQRFVKDKFPTEAVYGPTPFPVLRLVTCTGAFDVAHRNYLENLVVTAQLQAPIR